MEGNEGALYGTTGGGGAYTNQYGFGFGTVFKLNKDGSGYSVLYSFGGLNGDGSGPGGLIEGSDGALYGTTSGGGAYTNQYGDGLGTVFKLDKDGSGYSILRSFGGEVGDGQNPVPTVEWKGTKVRFMGRLAAAAPAPINTASASARCLS